MEALESIEGRKEKGNAAIGSDAFWAGCVVATELKSGFGASVVVKTAFSGIEVVGVEALESIEGRKEKGNAAIGPDDFWTGCAAATELKSDCGAGVVVETACSGVEDMGVEALECMDGRKEKGNAAIGSDDLRAGGCVAAAELESGFGVGVEVLESMEGRKEKGNAAIGSDDLRAGGS